MYCPGDERMKVVSSGVNRKLSKGVTSVQYLCVLGGFKIIVQGGPHNQMSREGSVNLSRGPWMPPYKINTY